MKHETDGPLSSYEPLIQHLLYLRGIKTKEDAEKFFAKEWEIESPFTFRDMEKAVERFIYAIDNNEKITVFSDYDCDGICGASVIHPLFRKLNYENVNFVIPDRHYDGYGLSVNHIEKASEDGNKLFITIDCGVTAADALERAKELNIDVIVIDHHQIPEQLPPMYAFIHYENKEGEETPFCGTALAFKFVCGVCERKRDVIKDGWEKWLLDVVGIATIADMVPMNGENRLLTHYGIIVLRKTKRIGLKVLKEKIKLNNNLNEDDVGFMISPRINAASRMGSAYDAFILLTTEDREEAIKKVEELESLNNKRKGLVTDMLRKIRNTEASKMPVKVFGESTFRPSLAGLVAQKLMEEHNAPVFVWGRSGNGEIKGSCRSPKGINVVELMKNTENCFEEFGGHHCAGGFTLREEKMFSLEEELSKAFNNLSKKEDVVSTVDCLLTIEMINKSIYDLIRKFAPFGIENEKPLFMLSDAKISKVVSFGKENNHTKYILKDKNGKTIEAISFFSEPVTKEGNDVSIYAYLDEPYGNGLPRLKIVDIEAK